MSTPEMSKKITNSRFTLSEIRVIVVTITTNKPILHKQSSKNNYAPLNDSLIESTQANDKTVPSTM